jgi:hypothetical protein
LHALHLSSAILAAGLLIGCGNGTFGDQPSTPLANQYGDGTRLCEAAAAPGVHPLGPAPWEVLGLTTQAPCPNESAVPKTRSFYATGLTLVAIDSHDETGSGATGNFYTQDTTCAGKPYSGVTIFGPSFSPPDLRLAENDVIDVLGTVEEFVGPSTARFHDCRTLPEASGTISFRFDSNGQPQPVVVPLSDFATYAGARQWLGMLVKVEGLSITIAPQTTGGRYTAAFTTGAGDGEDAKISDELYDIQKDGPTLAVGTTFKSVTGIVTYFFGFHLAPRSAADFEM